jgi:hypothetical protein
VNDNSFKRQIELVTAFYIPDFGIGATVLLSRFEKNLTSVTVGLNSEDMEEFNEFAMMVEMGFFILTGERYQMVIPTKLNMGKVKRAVLKFARTEDEDGVLRPEPRRHDAIRKGQSMAKTFTYHGRVPSPCW